jgi:hypothetical protein
VIPPDRTLRGHARSAGPTTDRPRGDREGATMKSLLSWLRPNPGRPESIRRTWDRERARAMSPSHRDEIDAIFSRYL